MSDTNIAGECFLSYCLCDSGYVECDDMFLGALVGTVRKEFLGLEVGTKIQVLVDGKDDRRFHVKVCPDGYESDDGDAWFVTTPVLFDFIVGDMVPSLVKVEYVKI